MPRTTNVQDQIPSPDLPEAAGVVAAAPALHAAVDRLEAHAAAGDAPIGGVRHPREAPAPGLLRRPDALDAVERQRQAAEILEPPAARRAGSRGGIDPPLIGGAAASGRTPQGARARRRDAPDVFHRRAGFLAAITARLCKRSLGAPEAPCGALGANRGAAGAGPAGGTPPAAAAASAPLSRWAHACTDRAGAAPSARRVARRPTQSPGLHWWAWRWPMPHRRPCLTWRGEVCRATTSNRHRSSGVGSAPF
jgi:hypothetical protein